MCGSPSLDELRWVLLRTFSQTFKAARGSSPPRWPTPHALNLPMTSRKSRFDTALSSFLLSLLLSLEGGRGLTTARGVPRALETQCYSQDWAWKCTWDCFDIGLGERLAAQCPGGCLPAVLRDCLNSRSSGRLDRSAASRACISRRSPSIVG